MKKKKKTWNFFDKLGTIQHQLLQQQWKEEEDFKNWTFDPQPMLQQWKRKLGHQPIKQQWWRKFGHQPMQRRQRHENTGHHWIQPQRKIADRFENNSGKIAHQWRATNFIFTTFVDSETLEWTNQRLTWINVNSSVSESYLFLFSEIWE